MSNTTYQFSILRVYPDAMRGESMNVGLAIFTQKCIRLFIEADITRLSALNADLRAVPWDDLAQHAESLLARLPGVELQRQALRGLLKPITMDDTFGTLSLEDGDTLEDRADEMLSKLVRKPAATMRIVHEKAKRESKLNISVRDWFKKAKLLSRKPSDLGNHKVVANYPISARSDLYAEFAFKNGEVHVIETVDLRRHEKVTESVRKEAAIKSITLDMAKEAFGDGGKRIAIISADDYAVMRPVINLINSYADDVVSLESPADRQRLADFIAKSLHQQNIPML